MTKRYPVSPAPGPLEDYVQSFDDLFAVPAPNATLSGATWKVCSYPPNATRL
jgi:hypothetical protein